MSNINDINKIMVCSHLKTKIETLILAPPKIKEYGTIACKECGIQISLRFVKEKCILFNFDIDLSFTRTMKKNELLKLTIQDRINIVKDNVQHLFDSGIMDTSIGTHLKLGDITDIRIPSFKLIPIDHHIKLIKEVI